MKLNRISSIFALLTMNLGTSISLAANGDGSQTSSKFEGPKVNRGTVTLMVRKDKGILRVSSDFTVPETPAPTWRVVDSKGTIFTLEAFKVKSGNGEKREVILPFYVPNIVKVQVYCAWAEVMLGEATFSSPVRPVMIKLFPEDRAR